MNERQKRIASLLLLGLVVLMFLILWAFVHGIEVIANLRILFP